MCVRANGRMMDYWEEEMVERNGNLQLEWKNFRRGRREIVKYWIWILMRDFLDEVQFKKIQFGMEEF